MTQLGWWIWWLRWRFEWYLVPIISDIVQITESVQPCGVRVVVKECAQAALSFKLGRVMLACPVSKDGFLCPDITLFSLPLIFALKRGYRITVPTLRNFYLLGRILRRAKVVHVHSISTLTVMVCVTSWVLRMLWIRQARMVYHFHVDHAGYFRCWFGDGLLTRVLTAITNWIVKKCLQQTSKPIYPSEHTRARYAKLLRYEHPQTVVVGNAVGLPRRKRRQARRKAGRILKALHIGRIGKEKSIKEILDFWLLMLNAGYEIEITFIGNGEIEKWKRYARNLSLRADKLIRFLGQGSRERVAELVEESDFGIFFSSTETFGLGPFEQMLERLPIVAIKGSCIGDAVLEAMAGIAVEVCMRDAEAAGNLISDADQRHEMGIRGSAYVRERFARPIIHRMMADIYEYMMS